MIRLDSTLNQKEDILEVINNALDNDELELECSFNNSPNKSHYSVKHANFISILKRFKGNPDFEAKTNTRLDISFPSRSKLNDTRILINGTGAINTFCNNDSLSQILNSVKFETKTRPKTRLSRVIIANYNIKFNIKQEKNFNNDEARIKDIIREWVNETKNYRYKKTFSFIKKTGDYQIDISIVKSSTNIDRVMTVEEVIKNNLLQYVSKPDSVKTMPFGAWWKTIMNKPNEKVMVRNGDSYYKNLKDSNVFLNPSSYEVEVEYIHNKTTNKPKFKNLEAKAEYLQKEFVGFFRIIGSILQCIQDSSFIISNDEKIEVAKQFTKVVVNSVDESMIASKSTKSLNLQGNKHQDKHKYKNQYKNQYKHQRGGKLNNDGDIDFSQDANTNANVGGNIDGNIDGNTGDANAGDVANTDVVDGAGADGADGADIYIGGGDDDDGDGDDGDGDDGDGADIYIGGGDDGANADDGDGADGANADGDGFDGADVDGFDGADVDGADVDGADNDNPGKNLQKGGAREIAELRNRITETFRQKGIFFGPLIIDLNNNNALKLDPKALPDINTNTNIHINYVVTDKTDGDRNLLFIDGSGNTYGIGREININKIKSYGISMPSLANTILDGEFVSRTEDNKVLNNFYIFDAYIYKNKAIIHLPFLFGKPNGRHNAIIEVVKYFNTADNIVQSNPKMQFMLYKKDYLLGDTAKSYQLLYPDEKPLISQHCERLLNKMNVKYGGFLEIGHLFPYKTDGLVFLPNNLGVFQQSENNNLLSISNPFVHSRWNNNYKWKPADHLTIDFKVVFIKDISGKLSYRYINNAKYLLVCLKSAVYQANNNKNKNNNNNDNNSLNFYLINSGIKIHSIPESFGFFAVNPFVGYYDTEGNLQNNMSDALFKVDNNDNILSENGDIITDGEIVECNYNISMRDEQQRWQPQRVRADKISPNNYLTAISAWELINKPITKEYISGIKVKLTEKDIINNMQKGIEGNDVLEDATYYSDNENTVFLTKPLNDFHGFVKRYLITRALTGYVKPRLMDLATGKCGDFFKYTEAGVHTLVGIEIGYDGLNNPQDGAATRITNISRTNPAVAKLAERTILIVGNTTKNIANGDCVRDNLNKYYLDVLYGRSKGNTPKLKKMEGAALDGFDCISCMYAIHYMMNNETDLDNFLRNVSENLSDQGYFIGTCLDGMSILKEMGNSNEISGIMEDKTIFLIRKMGNTGNLNNKSISYNYKDITVGNKIMVYYETFAGLFPENLVNMSYLKEQAMAHNLKLVEYRTFLEEPGNLLSKFGNINLHYVKKIKSSDALMTWAKFNAYFIFQKIRNE